MHAGNAAKPVLAPRKTDQGAILTGDVVNWEDFPAEGKQEEKDDTKLERPKDLEATPTKS